MPEEAPLYQYLSFKDEKPYNRYVPARQLQSGFGPEPEKKTATVPLTHGSYGALLLHPRWKSRREEILTRDMHRCIHCKKEEDLQIHHRQYHFLVSEQRFRQPWDYQDHLLITLCESCHSRGHSKFKVPIINI